MVARKPVKGSTQPIAVSPVAALAMLIVIVVIIVIIIIVAAPVSGDTV